MAVLSMPNQKKRIGGGALTAALALLLVSANVGQAVITLDSDRIPVGDGFEYLGGSLTGVTISDGIGFFEVADCPVGNNYNPDGCSESGFRVRVIPASFNSNQNDTCVGSHA